MLVQDWIQKLTGKFEKSDWHKDIVYHPPTDFTYYDFFEEIEYKENEAINPQNIIGLVYGYCYNDPVYKKKAYHWLEHLNSLKRIEDFMRGCKTTDKLKDVIFNAEEGKGVDQYGSKYIITSGQHRLCLAKFIGLEAVEVGVTKYRLNKQKFYNTVIIDKYFSQLKYFGLTDYENDWKNLLYHGDTIEVKINQKNIQLNKQMIKKLLRTLESISDFKFRLKEYLYQNQRKIKIDTNEDINDMLYQLRIHLKKLHEEEVY